ncbi:MAG: glutamate/tyrosine decarboxylase-like PLP-dependent enzyme [Desulforhopalus sp.]|jgi:glutamate/tyrosine decarboxylase-like PLP-dependent enzyme
MNNMNENEIFGRLLTVIESYRASQKNGKVLEYRSPNALSKILDLHGPEKNGDWESIFGWVEKYLTYSVKTNHPAFVNRMWVGANLPSVVGEIVAAVTNTSACTFESAPVSTLFEKYMIEQMLDVVGFVHGEGQMTTGSSNANMVAMMAARNIWNSKVKTDGLCGQKKLYAFVGSDSHYSMDKAANILGIGTSQLVKVDINANGEMILEALRASIEKVVSEGGEPFFVAATAGTTVRGAYDPIEPLVELRKEFGFWLHVDGAWGGASVLSPILKEKYLKGLEDADSFTCDFHKMLGSSLMCNILLINKRVHTFGTVLSAGDGSYLFRDEHINEIEDFGTVSLQCGRRVDSLKWFLDWKFFGREGLARRVEGYLSLCEYAEEIVVKNAALEMVAPRTSFNICFRYKAVGQDANSFNLALRTALYQEGLSLVGVAYIEGKMVMRLLITNPDATKADVDNFFARVVEVGNRLVQE